MVAGSTMLTVAYSTNSYKKTYSYVPNYKLFDKGITYQTNIRKPISFDFDGQNRIWVATTRNRDTFSYFDIWTGPKYIGAVRVQDRLMGFDIFGSTLVTLLERTPGELAIDWYDLASIKWSH